MDVEKITKELKNANTNSDIKKALSECSIIIQNIDIKIKEKDINDSKTLQKIKNPKYCQALIFTIEELSKHGYSEVAKSLLKDILISKGQNQGKFFEMMAYYTLYKKRIDFTPQVHIKSESCFKQSNDGYEADGEITDLLCVFDVKEFGIGFPHITDFKIRLQEKVNQLFDKKISDFIEECSNEIKKKDRIEEEKKAGLWNYTITIDGLCNMGTDELSSLIENVNTIAKKLVNQAWEERIDKWKDCSTWDTDNPIVKYGKGFFQEKIKDIGLTCTLESEISKNLRGVPYMGVYEMNTYEWAMKNKFYFMGDASQFVINQPYMVICVLDKSDNIFLHDINQYDAYFRPLCRRIFIELNRMTSRDIQTSFDGKARSGISISEASKKITGILFLEISTLLDEERSKTPMWIYLNPNADNPLLGYQINKLHIMSPKIFEDYKFDNY